MKLDNYIKVSLVLICGVLFLLLYPALTVGQTPAVPRPGGPGVGAPPGVPAPTRAMPGAEEEEGPVIGGRDAAVPVPTGATPPPSAKREGPGAETGAESATAAAGAAEGGVKSDVTGPLTEEEQVYLNVQDADIKDVIKQISKATGRNFIIDDKIGGKKVTIISEKPMTREEAYQTFLSALEVAGFTTVKGPANVIKIVPLKEASRAPIPTHVDSTPYTDAFITRLIPLENISANDMMTAIKELGSPEGNMFAYPDTNTLVITDSGSNIDRLMKIIKELDQEGPQQVMEIIPIKNAMATDIAKMVQELFNKEKAGATARKAPRKGGGELEEMEAVSKIIPDERTNSLIVFASKRAIENVKDIIARLDSKLPLGDEGRIHVYYLKHAKAKDLAETLAAITSQSSTAAKTKQGAAGAAAGGGVDIAVARFEGGVKITADEPTNALIITALPKDFQTLIDKVISKLDIPRRQVYFEAVVMELHISKGDEYGVSGMGGKGVGSGLIGFGETMGGPSTLSSAMTGGWPALLGGLISQRTTNLTVLGSDGTTSTVTVPAFSAFLSALATRGETNVVATPNLLTLDNEEATMQVLSKEPVPGSTTYGAQGIATTPSVDYKEAGLELKIKPQITEGDMVRLEIEQKLANFVLASYSKKLDAPAMKERKVKTVVVTEDGQTVVLAGLMDDISQRTKKKIPLLGDIPLLGFFFSTTANQMSKNNLLIFITPHIIKEATDFSEILKRKIQQRNEFIDTNYSKSKKQYLRNVIKTHREDLLDIKDGEPPVTEGVVPVIQPSGAPVQPIPQPVQPKPVITVKDGMTMKGEKLPEGVTIESSAWKSVEPPAYPQPVTQPVAPPVTSKTTAVPAPAPSVPTTPPTTVEKKKQVSEPTAAKKPLEVPLPAEAAPKVEPKVSEPKVVPKKVEPVVSEPKVEPKAEPKKKETAVKSIPETVVTPTPAPKAVPEAETIKKVYKKPVVPAPAFEEGKVLNGNGNGKSAKWLPTTPTPTPPEEAVKVPQKSETKTPVITVPKEEVKKEEKGYKKPAPGSRNGELDLEY